MKIYKKKWKFIKKKLLKVIKKKFIKSFKKNIHFWMVKMKKKICIILVNFVMDRKISEHHKSVNSLICVDKTVWTLTRQFGLICDILFRGLESLEVIELRTEGKYHSSMGTNTEVYFYFQFKRIELFKEAINYLLSLLLYLIMVKLMIEVQVLCW